MATFPHLMSPIQVGPITVRNRIVSSAHLTGLSQEDRPTQRMVDYHAARAAGGAGLIITESMSVHPTSRQEHNVVSLCDEGVVPALRQLTDAVHFGGARILCQLHHAGRQQEAHYTQLAPWAPSPVMCPMHREVPHEMTKAEIAEIVEAFASCAERVVGAGYDGVEVHFAHGYLIQQFLSPWSNKRTDEYGGSVENRLRFGREILRAVRSRVPDAVVGIRINGDEFVDGGLTQQELQEMAVQLAQEKIDYIGLSAGIHYMPHVTIPPMSAPLGLFVYFAADLRERVTIPVIASHRIKDVFQAEEILASGRADLVAMTRAQIADPEMANKVREGRPEDIRPCLGCMEGCIGRVRLGWPISCVVNAQVGRERELGIAPAAARKKIAVVGGGPGGMEAARVLRLRGHDVDLYEQESELGGQLRYMARLPLREEFFELPRWQAGQLEKLGVRIFLKSRFAPELVTERGYQAVVVATGAAYGRPSTVYSDHVPHLNVIEGVELAGVEGKTLLIVERDWHNKGLHLAEKYAKEGAARVVILTEAWDTAADLDTANKFSTFQRLRSQGVRWLSHGRVKRLVGRDAYLDHEGEEVVVPGVDYVVVVEKPVAQDGLARDLQGRYPEVELRLVGGAYAPRRALDAVHDGFRAALRV